MSRSVATGLYTLAFNVLCIDAYIHQSLLLIVEARDILVNASQ